ncbi:4897_t:CDS:1, partial [Funneliformis geosporum]
DPADIVPLYENDRQIAKSWNNERSHNKVHLHQPTITCENISRFNGLISMNKNGIFSSGSTISKRDYEEVCILFYLKV